MLTGKEITELRKRLGLTPTELAAKLGVTDNAVWKWEHDVNHPKWDTMVKLNQMAEELDAQTETSK